VAFIRSASETARRSLAAEAARQEVDGVVCGHIHHPADRMMHGVRYLNCGDWVESCTALGERPDGTLEIIHWPVVLDTVQSTEVEAEQAAAGLQALQDRSRVPPAAEGAIHRDLAGVRPKALQHFGHHDGPVRPGRRLARRQDLVDVRGIPLGIAFLVLLVEPARVTARVPRSARADRRRVGGRRHHGRLYRARAADTRPGAGRHRTGPEAIRLVDHASHPALA